MRWESKKVRFCGWEVIDADFREGRFRGCHFVMMPTGSHETVRILDLDFAIGGVAALADAALDVRGLVTVPSAPCLALAARDSSYAADLAASALIIPDSGAMVLAWRFSGRGAFPRVSGLAFLQAVLEDERLRVPGALFLVDPAEEESLRNREFLQDRGIPVEASHQYVAPVYAPGDVTDPILLKRLKQVGPRYVLINLGGGIQERLGAWLQAHWNTGESESALPAICCTGAAIAFLTGLQTHIPPWADRFFLGWAMRCLSRPRHYIPRYGKALPSLCRVWWYGWRRRK